MTNEQALKAWKKLYSEIDKENWLFVGTINPQMVELTIKALEEKLQGEWKEHYGLYICSECGQVIGKYKKNYCATCGAYMRGEKND